MKNTTLVILAISGILLFFSLLAISIESETLSPTHANLLVQINDDMVDFCAYNINGNNYFKLRDLAYALNDTVKQFDVTWDAGNNAVLLSSDKPYTVIGGEMSNMVSDSQIAYLTTSKVFLDGVEMQLIVYYIGGNNYFKLRDLGQALNFCVEWNAASRIICIDCYRPYTIDSNFDIAETIGIDTNTETSPASFFDAEDISSYADEAVRLINIERAKNDLPPLAINSDLAVAAQQRAVELHEKFDHIRPDGRSSFSVFDDFGIKAKGRGETLALGSAYNKPGAVVQEWIDSPAHLDIMVGNFSQIGVGVVRMEVSNSKLAVYAWVAFFIL